jgi:uncharacterized membrane protein
MTHENISENIMEKSRLNFVDFMRGLAMVVMIEVHVVNSLMDPALRSESWFYFVNFINGLVAPGFIFVSGFAFMLGSQYRLDELRTFRYAFWKQLGRIMLIWFLGYMLHIPFFSRYKCMNLATRDHWLHFMGVDVLQCIALGLFVIFILRILIKSDRLFIITAAVLGFIAVVPAPWIYDIDFTKYLPLFLAMYITPVHSTIFPVVPWFGFMAVGILSAWVFMKFRESGTESIFIKRVLLAGIALFVISLPLLFYLKDYARVIQDLGPNILFFTVRLGCVFMILAASYHFCAGRGKIHPIILYPSRESLAVYFMHLQVLHRELWHGKSVITAVNHSLGFGVSLFLSVALILAMLPMAWAWNHYKTGYRYFGRIAVAVMLTAGMIIFMLR